ncbi:hypothetical protein J1614_001435 [Plenodomus biglobosus]|nr:hypothetical protein J1614_001435 [Plenodomus biglobosus]
MLVVGEERGEQQAGLETSGELSHSSLLGLRELIGVVDCGRCKVDGLHEFKAGVARLHIVLQQSVAVTQHKRLSGVITLKDNPEHANAIECMISYFYKADYDVSQFDIPESLLHAQVAVMADKYDCASLYKLARTSLADTVDTAKGEDWVAVAALIYDHTTTNLPAHKELRDLVVAAVANRPVELKSILELESTAGVLRSTADLATDLLLSGPYMSKANEVTKSIFTCGRCQYVHVGSGNCAYFAGQKVYFDMENCPCCESSGGTTFGSGHMYTVGSSKSFPCPSCDGIHTVEPVCEPQQSTVDASN